MRIFFCPISAQSDMHSFVKIHCFHIPLTIEDYFRWFSGNYLDFSTFFVGLIDFKIWDWIDFFNSRNGDYLWIKINDNGEIFLFRNSWRNQILSMQWIVILFCWCLLADIRMTECNWLHTILYRFQHAIFGNKFVAICTKSPLRMALNISFLKFYFVDAYQIWK